MKRFLSYISLTFILLDILSPIVSFKIPLASATATAVLYAGTATDLSDSSFAWANPTNAQGNTTGTFSQVTLNSNPSLSNTLALKNFNFIGQPIPVGASIVGIQVDVEWNGSNNNVRDISVQLTKNGTVGVGSNLGLNSGQTTKAIRTYGSTTELWGTTWTKTDITATNFGVLLQYNKTGGGNRNARVYRVSITVEYNSAPTNISLSSNSINEGLAIGSTVGLLSTTDPDVGDTHTYSLSCSSPGTDDASFTIAGNNLNSAEVFNFATKSVYNICIRTTDNGGLTYDKNFVVNINEVINVAPGGVDVNLEVWLKANAGTSTTTDGNTLASWADQSGNGLDASAVNAPIYRNNATDSLNFNPVIDFDGTTQYMENLANGAYSDSYFMVIIPDNDVEGTSSQGVPFGWDCLSGTLSSGTCGLNFSGIALGAFTAAFPDEVITHALGSSANWRSAQTAIAIYEAGKPMLIGVNENTGATDTEIYEKGAQVNNANINTYQTLSTADYNIGRAPDATYPFYYDGKIAEVINYSGTINSTDRNKIESYLSLKYGMTLNNGTQNYIASDGSTTYWSTVTAGSYTNSIFGIGRDDTSELGQIQSKSVNNDAVITLQALGEGTNFTPSFVDMGDKEFLSISNDTGSNAWSAIDAPATYNILSRKWKVQETGDVGTISLDFDVADTDFDIPVLNAGTNYYFVYDSNTNGNLADETPLLMTNTSGDIWQISGINLSNTQIFTIATQASSNNIPTDITLSNNTIDENVANGSTIGTLSTTDLDVGDTHTYTLVSGTGDDDNGNFSLSGSTLTINNSPDYELKNTYTLRIETDDGNGGTYQEAFDIFINNLGEAITTIIDFEDISDEEKYTVTSGIWDRNTVNPQEGSYSLESDNGGLDNTQSCFEVQHTFSASGTIDFQYSVSSEAASDFLRFYIDDIEQGSGWSGTVAYTSYTSSEISTGTHDYKWCYIKDGAGSAGTDNAYIDYITFPNTAGDITAPTISSINFASGSLLPGGNHNIIISYSDSESGIDTSSDTIALYKWNGVAWGSDISATGLDLGSKTVTSTTATYPTNNLVFGKYRYDFTISDNSANSSATGAVFYIDEPEITVSTGSIDIGSVDSFSNNFSDTVTVTVKTVGAGFNLILNRSSNFTEGIENIPSWDGIKGYGYDPSPFSSSISTINTDEVLATQGASINVNGNKNTYTYDIKLGALVEDGQSAGDYLGNLDFGINLDY